MARGPVYRSKIDKRRLALFISLVGVALIGILALVFWTISRNGDSGGIIIPLYYYDGLEGNWSTEPYEIRLTGQSDNDMVSVALDRLSRLPEQQSGTKSLPRGILEESAVDGRTCVVRLSEEGYGKMTIQEKAVAMTSLVYTLTGFDFVDNVSLYVGNEEIGRDDTTYGVLDRNKIIMDNELLPDNIGVETVTLYFADAGLTALVSVEREIELQPNKPFENHLLEELIAGPAAKDLARLIPADVRINGNIRVDSNICYVDFSTDFLQRVDNDELLGLTVRSVVATLLDNTGAMQVQLFFKGERTAAVHSTMDLGNPLSRE